MKNSTALLIFTLNLIFIIHLNSQGFLGYYQQPEIYGDQIYFAAEGDLWKVSTNGGLAMRLTSHLGNESHPKVSPDGKFLAFTASYEGPNEVYTMPVSGGSPTRWTFEQESSIATCWTPGGEIVYTSTHFSTLPDPQLIKINLESKHKISIPLSQASEANYNNDGSTVYFVRPAYHRNVTKRYKGGTARKIWKFTNGSKEAECLTCDYDGESHHPMYYGKKVYFISDRDGIMNLWSMDDNGRNLIQLTYHEDFDIREASYHLGKIVYRKGADLWLYNIASNEPKLVPITLASDLDQLRDKWVDNPVSQISSAHLDHLGEKVVITARGRIFSAPVSSGRFIQLAQEQGVRFRDAVFLPDGDSVVVLSDQSGEFEFNLIPSNGIGAPKPITHNGDILRYEGLPSPDGKWLAFDDLRRDLWLVNINSGQQIKISQKREGIRSFSWSPDSKKIAFVEIALNDMAQIFIYDLEDANTVTITTDRANSLSPKWSEDGKWIYFLSDRNFQSLVGAPWGPRQPEPYFDRQMKIYHIPLKKGLRSPFRPADELYSTEKESTEKDSNRLIIDTERIPTRITEVPIPAGNYRNLAINEEAIFYLSRSTGLSATTDLMSIKLSSKDVKPTPVVKGVQGFELSGNGKKLLVRKSRNLYVVNAGAREVRDLNDLKVDFSNWKFKIDTQQDWKQIFTDAWRMERDYFYDENMHGVDWQAMHKKYFPLVNRITTRSELSDLIGRFVGELSALHTSVRGGDIRTGDENINVSSLGARFVRSEEMGGYEITYIYQADPDYPNELAPLADPYLNIAVGNIITHVNGVHTLSSIDIGELLLNQSGEQVRIGIKSGNNSRDVIVKPIRNEYNLRYRDWEYNRRMEVEKLSDNKIGYVHLRAMGSNDLAQWYREFYPVFNRQGLIVDVRHNRGGNIESFILEKLMRKAWMYWKTREGEPYWNMQYAFRGHIVVLCDQNTASDGEAFADGFRRLGLGTVIGMRTWGGEIWLSSVNRLSDGGLARAPMMGVYGPEGEWLIEGHGFEPDIIVDNLPHETYNGKDAQLEAAIDYLLNEIKKDPRQVPDPPAYPDKSFKNNRN